jgi:Domain of unknown function (DUF4398)
MSALLTKIGAPAAAVAMLALLAGCGGVSELTKERVARSETQVKQAEQTVGNSENGALELERARNHLRQAQRALDDDDETEAERHAQLAQLDADLAIARAQSASARRAADELQASIRTLREEADRGEQRSRERDLRQQ